MTAGDDDGGDDKETNKMGLTMVKYMTDNNDESMKVLVIMGKRC